MKAMGTAHRSTSWPLGLLGMLGLIAVSELAMACPSARLMAFSTLDWPATGRAASCVAASSQVLCFGDSLVKFGVAPAVLEPRLGRRVYNLSVCGGQAPSSYFLLQRALAAGARPKAILIDFMPHLLDLGPRQNERQWPEFVGLSEFVELSATAHNAAFSGAMALEALLPSIRCRYEMRHEFQKLLRGGRAQPRVDLAVYERNWAINRGALVAPVRKGNPGRARLERWEIFMRPWSCHPVNAAYLEKLLRLSATRAIPVFVLLPPVRADVQARREQLGIDHRYVHFLETIQRQHANVSIVDARHAGFAPSSFLDPLHLNREGAVAYSARLAEIIGQCLQEPAEGRARWIAVEGPGEPPGTVALEDLEQSRRALQAAGSGVRL